MFAIILIFSIKYSLFSGGTISTTATKMTASVKWNVVLVDHDCIFGCTGTLKAKNSNTECKCSRENQAKRFKTAVYK